MVKKSFYKLAKKYHPDRVEEAERSSAKDRFYIIHQAYTILSNQESKDKYDSGCSSGSLIGLTIAAKWEQHMKTVTKNDMEEASKRNKNSAAEEEDIIRELTFGNGSMTHLLSSLPFMRAEDEGRLIVIIKTLKQEGKIPEAMKIKKIPSRKNL